MPVNQTNVATGSCGTDTQSITVQWGNKSQMMLQFTANTTAQQFMLSELDLTINASDVFADAKGKFMKILWVRFCSECLGGHPLQRMCCCQ